MILEKIFPPDIRVEKEARSLINAGHEIILLSLASNHFPDEEIWEGIKVVRKKLPNEFLKRAWNYFFFQCSFIHPLWRTALEEAVKQYKIEVIHVHDLPLVKTALIVARKFNIPLIADLHENFPEAIKVYPSSWIGNLLKPLIVKRWKKLEKYCVQKANKVVTVVDEAKQHYIFDCEIPPEKITVITNTEDLDYFYSLPIYQEIIEQYSAYFTICYIGGFGQHRGIHTAISAMPKILKEIPNARLLLVGKGPNEAVLLELTKRMGISHAVDFTGWQPFEKVPSYTAASRVCIIPHIASGHTNSTIPHKLFQAMAMAKPVIVSSAKPLERIVHETRSGLVYPSGDAKALADAVIKIWQDDNLEITLGEAGKKAVKNKYNWKLEEKKLINLYNRLHT